MSTLKTVAAIGLAVTMVACTHPYAMGPGGGYGPGPGMGPGPGAGPGYWGMGPGMMGGDYGPGMMGGGYGPGMMMGHPGAMWGLERLDLSAEQRRQIAQIQEEAQRQHWEWMRAMHAQDGPHWWGPPDEQGERRSYEAMAALHKQMFEAHLQTRKRILEVLTPEQREQLGRGWRGR